MNDGKFQNDGNFTVNATGAQLECYGIGSGSGGVFNNTGSFTKLGTGTAKFWNIGNSMVFNNAGTVAVQAGDLRLEWQGTHTGDFSVAAGSTLSLTGTQSFAATTDFSGSGTVNVFHGR